MKNVSTILLLFALSVAHSFGDTVPVYVDDTTGSIVSPSAFDPALLPVGWSDVDGTPTTLSGYGITNGLPNSQGLNYLLFGDGTFEYIQKKDGNAQNALGLIGVNGGGQLGTNATTTHGGAAGFSSGSTLGFGGGNNATTTSGASVGQWSKSTDGFGIGNFAEADGPGRGQLGEGTNTVDNTIQFRDSGSVTPIQFGRIATNTRVQTSSGFTLVTDYVILASNSSGMKVSLLSAATVGDGYILHIKNIGLSGTITVDSPGTETIDGELSITLTIQYESVTLVTDGSNWFIL